MSINSPNIGWSYIIRWCIAVDCYRFPNIYTWQPNNSSNSNTRIHRMNWSIFVSCLLACKRFKVSGNAIQLVVLALIFDALEFDNSILTYKSIYVLDRTSKIVQAGTASHCHVYTSASLRPRRHFIDSSTVYIDIYVINQAHSYKQKYFHIYDINSTAIYICMANICNEICVYFAFIN